MEYENIEKLFNMHFGPEYKTLHKNKFTKNLKEIYNYIESKSPKSISITMFKR